MGKKRKKILITAGHTIVPIDQVRSITNIFRGRTGTTIAEHIAWRRPDATVTLLTSSPELVKLRADNLEVIRFRTFDDLLRNMAELVCLFDYDIIIHSAAVSDYSVAEIYELIGNPVEIDGQLYLPVKLVDRSGKISSKHKSLLMRLVQTDKIIDKIRSPWGFRGILVKFKLEVGVSDRDLIAVALDSMKQSKANIIVANTLERSRTEAFIVEKNIATRVSRHELPADLMERIGLDLDL